MAESIYASLLQEQKTTKPAIEDVIPQVLDGGMAAAALDFAAHMRASKLALKWAGFTNAWKAVHKGKCICYVRLRQNSDCMDKAWVITPYLDHANEYEDTAVSEGLHHIVFRNLFYCKRCFPEKYPEGRPCVPGRNIALFGKEIAGVCRGRQPVWFWEPDGEAVGCVKRLLELEKLSRT